jgi:hypothetical protein
LVHLLKACLQVPLLLAVVYLDGVDALMLQGDVLVERVSEGVLLLEGHS